MPDQLHRFSFENFNVRGEFVSLDAIWRAVLDRHAYAPPVRDYLGQAMVAATLLSATIKLRGALFPQIQGSGAGSHACFGAASLIQRFGACLNRHVHHHCCVIEAMFEPLDEAADVPEAVRFKPAAGRRLHLLPSLSWESGFSALDASRHQT